MVPLRVRWPDGTTKGRLVLRRMPNNEETRLHIPLEVYYQQQHNRE